MSQNGSWVRVIVTIQHVIGEILLNMNGLKGVIYVLCAIMQCSSISHTKYGRNRLITCNTINVPPDNLFGNITKIFYIII